MGKKSVCGLTAGEFTSACGEGKFSPKHLLQVTNAIYKKGINRFDNIEGIPKSLKDYLGAEFITGIYPPESMEQSADGTVKYLFRNSNGLYFETVFIPDGGRNTVCVSTQSGCRMGCPFCVTAKYGFHGNLDTSDILNQVLAIPGNGSITNVVFMGMGEPLDNLGNVMKSCEILCAEWGKALGAANITVSTVGITPGVRDILENSRCNLTLSLFSPFPEERIAVVPAEKKYPAVEIISMMKSYSKEKRRRLSVAYVMIDGVNDSDRHLEGLRELLSGSGIRVNLIPYHMTPGDNYRQASGERMRFFRHSLTTGGISASIRKSRGEDISAACGLLASGLGNSSVN